MNCAVCSGTLKSTVIGTNTSDPWCVGCIAVNGPAIFGSSLTQGFLDNVRNNHTDCWRVDRYYTQKLKGSFTVTPAPAAPIAGTWSNTWPGLGVDPHDNCDLCGIVVRKAFENQDNDHVICSGCILLYWDNFGGNGVPAKTLVPYLNNYSCDGMTVSDSTHSKIKAVYQARNPGIPVRGTWPNGLSCSKCKEHNPYAEPNRGNEYYCYKCTNRWGQNG